MSEHGYEQGQPGAPEAKSSIAIEQTAKGAPVVKIKLYDGVTEDEINRLRSLAVTAYKETCQQVGAVAA